METSLDEAAAQLSAADGGRLGFSVGGGGHRRYHPAGGEAMGTGGGATATAMDTAAADTDYLTASLGRYKGGGTGGALPLDRYRGRRIRCKAVLRSNMPNDKGREVRLFVDYCTAYRPGGVGGSLSRYSSCFVYIGLYQTAPQSRLISHSFVCPKTIRNLM